MKKVVLAYSGGLDTSFCIHYLKNNEGYEVHSVIVNTGAFTDEELKLIEKKAYDFGSSHHEVVDASSEYYEKCIRFLIYGNILRNRNYPLSVSSERIFQALKVLGYATKNNIGVIAHGSSGAGNDQVRFETVFNVLAPDTEIIAPVRDLSITREQEIDYLIKAGIAFNFEKLRYSVNHGLWGTSVAGNETFSSTGELPDKAYPSGSVKTGIENISIDFESGDPVGLNERIYDDKVKLIRDLEELASPYGIGRDTHVGETIIGIKGRIGFQASAATILINAHYYLEKHVLSKWQQYWKEQLGNWYGMLLHDGLLMEPSMRDIESFLLNSQRNVTGKVFVRLRPYHMQVTGVETGKDLMNCGFAKYGEEPGSWTADDIKGFTKIISTPLKIYYTVNPNEKPEF